MSNKKPQAEEGGKAATPANQQTVQLNLEKETKNTIRFQEQSEEETGNRQLIGTLYVQKHVFGKPPWPGAVLITIAW